MLGASRAALFWDKMCVRLDESKAPLLDTGDRALAVFRKIRYSAKAPAT
jgi:hypothetical protein